MVQAPGRQKYMKWCSSRYGQVHQVSLSLYRGSGQEGNGAERGTGSRKRYWDVTLNCKHTLVNSAIAPWVQKYDIMQGWGRRKRNWDVTLNCEHPQCHLWSWCTSTWSLFTTVQSKVYLCLTILVCKSIQHGKQKKCVEAIYIWLQFHCIAINGGPQLNLVKKYVSYLPVSPTVMNAQTLYRSQSKQYSSLVIFHLYVPAKLALHQME